MRTIKVSTFVLQQIWQGLNQCALESVDTCEVNDNSIHVDRRNDKATYEGTYGTWEVKLRPFNLQTKGSVRPVDDTALAYKDDTISTN